MGLDWVLWVINGMVLLLEHEIDGDVLELGLLWDVGLGPFPVIIMSNSCIWLVIIVDFMVFSVINGGDHVFEFIVWVFYFQGIREEFFHDFRVRYLHMTSNISISFVNSLAFSLFFKLKLIINNL